MKFLKILVAVFTSIYTTVGFIAAEPAHRLSFFVCLSFFLSFFLWEEETKTKTKTGREH